MCACVVCALLVCNVDVFCVILYFLVSSCVCTKWNVTPGRSDLRYQKERLRLKILMCRHTYD